MPVARRRCTRPPGSPRTPAGPRLFLKREDLNHRISQDQQCASGRRCCAPDGQEAAGIAETGAGQHGVATLPPRVPCSISKVRHLHGAVDTARQALNVARMRLLGAEVVSVDTGSATLKDAITEAFRDLGDQRGLHLLLFRHRRRAASVPDDGARLPARHRPEARVQIQERVHRLPDAVTACVGGGSNAIGIFHAFIDDPGVRLVGLLRPPATAWRPAGTRRPSPADRRSLPGSCSYLLQDEDGRDHRIAFDLSGFGLPRRRPRACLALRTSAARSTRR